MSRKGRSRRTRLLVTTVTALAVVVLVLALPAAIRFAVDAPSGFWAMALAALVVDAPLFGAVRRDDLRRSTLSVCFTFAIFVLWGAAPAIVVQAIAGAVTVAGQRYHRLAGLVLVSRLVLAAAVAEFFVKLVGPRPITPRGGGLAGADLVTFLLLALVWCAVTYGLLVAVRATMSEGGLRQATTEIALDLFGTTATVLVVSPLLTSVSGWWPLYVAAPLVVWNGLSRAQLSHEAALIREPVSGSLNRQGLAAGMRALTAFDAIEPERPRPFAIILVTSDVFFMINRALGRETYELVATVASRRLIEVFGRNQVARLSGEGLVIVVPDLTETDALAAAEVAVAVVSGRIEVNDIPFTLDAHGGVAVSPQHGRDLDTLLLKAELAVAEARRQDQNVALYKSQASDVAARRIELLRAFHTALREPARQGEITVLYQPQITIGSGRLYGVEALVRWTHPVIGAVATDELIDTIERSDVIHLLTRYMLATVMRQIQQWNGQGHRLRVAVNISVRDLHDPAFVDDLLALVRAHGVPPAQLTIEITERMFIGDAPRAEKVCRSLARHGFGLSLDDFGTGHASLQQLRQLPLSEVKIDRSYTHGAVDNPADLAIVASVHRLAQVLGVSVVAEGVEDQRMADVLANLEGVIGQGYHFGRPMTANAMAEFVRRGPD